MVATRVLEQLRELVSGLHGLRNAVSIMEFVRIMECKDYGMRIAMPSLGSAKLQEVVQRTRAELLASEIRKRGVSPAHKPFFPGKFFAPNSPETWVFGVETGSVRCSPTPCRSAYGSRGPNMVFGTVYGPSQFF